MVCSNLAREEGLICRPTLNGRIALAPALVATRLEIDELIEKLKRALDRLNDKVAAANNAAA